jgi:hypothetical protein
MMMMMMMMRHNMFDHVALYVRRSQDTHEITRIQKTFNPADYEWKWTEDWYEWASKPAHTFARRDRDAEAKRLKAEGCEVTKFTLRDQLISRGGIGSGHPHIEVWVTIYGLNARKDC